MGRKVKGRKSKGRKGQGRKRKSEWWSENFFAIRDLIWAIYFRVEEADPASTTCFANCARGSIRLRPSVGKRRGHADGAHDRKAEGFGKSDAPAKAAHMAL